MRLVGAASQGSGSVNEDAFGYAGAPDNVTAAWVFDGVTSINPAPVLAVPSEPAWFVEMANRHLARVVEQHSDVLSVLRVLVPCLEEEWANALAGRRLPSDYDLPAACLTLALRTGSGWQVLRLGDSLVLSGGTTVVRHPFPPSELPDLETELRHGASRHRASGAVDDNTLRDAFRHRLSVNRTDRNLPGSYSILLPDASSLNMPQVIELGASHAILLCTDGFYRAVDTYALHDDKSLMEAAARPGGVEAVLADIRAIEAADLACRRFARFKAADDVSAVMLSAR